MGRNARWCHSWPISRVGVPPPRVPARTGAEYSLAGRVKYRPHSGRLEEGPSKGPSTCGRGLKPPVPERQVLLALLFVFLTADVLPHHLFIQANRAHAVSSRPEMKTREVPLLPQSCTAERPSLVGSHRQRRWLTRVEVRRSPWARGGGGLIRIRGFAPWRAPRGRVRAQACAAGTPGRGMGSEVLPLIRNPHPVRSPPR